MNIFKINCFLLAFLGLLSCLFCLNGCRPDPTIPSIQQGLKLSIHSDDGIAFDLSADETDLFLGRTGPTLFLLLSNNTEKSVALWKPNCVEGDRTFRLEFKEDPDSDDIGIARRSQMYTGGMGIPKTVDLKSTESIIVPIDLSSYWSIPFDIEKQSSKSILMRAAYESHPKKVEIKGRSMSAQNIWEGKIMTDWHKIKLHGN